MARKLIPGRPHLFVVGGLALLLVVASQCQPVGLGSVVSPLPGPVPAETEVTGNLSSAGGPFITGPLDPSDLLAAVQARGVLRVGLRVWPDANFTPPAFRDPVGGALTGFEVELARALADALGVELELIPVDPQILRHNDWQGEWDLALASLPITDNARQFRNFSDPYIYLPVGVLVHADNNHIADLATLSGQTVGVPFETAVQASLEGELISVEGQPLLERRPDDVMVNVYTNDAQAIRDLAAEDGVMLDAVAHYLPTLQAAVDFGLPVKLVPGALFLEPIGVAFDQAGPPSAQLREVVNAILAALRTDGTLAELSLRWYGEDYSIFP